VIVPSIDIIGGTAVQLIGGETRALDAGNPISVLERLGRVGEVAVVDIDAARGEGDNYDLIAEMCRVAPVRVGGGVRDADLARRWLDAGATRIIVGTAASEELLAELPSERVIVALDARDGQVVTHGWRHDTGRGLIESVRRFAGLCGGFLVTFVEREGRMGGTDLDLAGKVVGAAGEARVTIAGGITTVDEVAQLDRLGADAQIGMALYTGRLGLAEAFAAPLVSDRTDGLWPTVIVDEHDVALGLAYSSLESLQQALETGQGVYHSRRRGIWVKGESSGATQELIDVSADCDRDTLRFRVRQHGSFCHLDTRTCWGEDHGLSRLERRLRSLATDRPIGSNTVRLLDDPSLLDAKILEEAAELTANDADVAPEAADLVYFALVKSVAAGVTVEDIERILDHRERKVTRRPINAKEVE
jgi:phosphoribosyl-ATP pyrophosphohydrolase/phosphoribosyl-AMP cyclohydrolase